VLALETTIRNSLFLFCLTMSAVALPFLVSRAYFLRPGRPTLFWLSNDRIPFEVVVRQLTGSDNSLVARPLGFRCRGRKVMR
jgi:hypothetical protein